MVVSALNWPFPITARLPTSTATTGRRDKTTGKTISQTYGDPIEVTGSFHPNPLEDEALATNGDIRPGDAVFFCETRFPVGALVDVSLVPAGTTPTFERSFRVKGLLHPQALIHKHTGKQRFCWHLGRREGRGD